VAVPDRCPFHRRLADTAFSWRGFFHFGAHGVQVVAGRDHWEQQNECAAQNANKGERRGDYTSCSSTGSGRGGALPPQQQRRQQQRKPTEIKEKLHSKRPGLAEETRVGLPQDHQNKQDSTETTSNLGTLRGQEPLQPCVPSLHNLNKHRLP